ncbi:Flavodoxin-like fold [Paenibacillus sp. UNCCL117]|uniref:NAD(P)H-dependent oxidoreductase n=1 Tax=unclassified Paenibacillus TaxID=185978 RepID=UPI000882FC49|nr:MULTISPECIES: NAD(P)H-dependent oxidoreductase [unclassified Paenibacillus]SDD51278.1 Flavodoxin-like fold [Paenibacillus sp. cl123]SFW49552.1 Flavodoxin-like fold [Paenibacillus sp. UNCCL117]
MQGIVEFPDKKNAGLIVIVSILDALALVCYNLGLGLEDTSIVITATFLFAMVTLLWGVEQAAQSLYESMGAGLYVHRNFLDFAAVTNNKPEVIMLKSILYITANPKSERNSNSLTVGRCLVNAYRLLHPSASVTEIDVYRQPIPLVDEHFLSARQKNG